MQPLERNANVLRFAVPFVLEHFPGHQQNEQVPKN